MHKGEERIVLIVLPQSTFSMYIIHMENDHVNQLFFFLKLDLFPNYENVAQYQKKKFSPAENQIEY